MTGRELVVYILENHLEDEQVCKDGKVLNLLTQDEFAERCHVGVATVKTWYELHMINGIKIGDVIYILPNAKLPDGEVSYA